jgi:hypothetical protein
VSAILILCSAISLFGEPLPQNPTNVSNETIQTENDLGQASSTSGTSGPGTSEPSIQELPDAPQPERTVQQNQNESSSKQENQGSVPSGTAAAKAPVVKGAPASRTVGAAIAPAKQKQHRSLLIKMGLVAGACVAVGTAFALSKASPSKPPGAP